MNSASAVARLAGNTKLYVKTLCLFFKSIPHHESEIGDSFERGDKQRLHRAAHTLKGLAATIGATELATLSAAVETGINNTDSLPESSSIAQLKALLARLSDGIAASGLCDSGEAPVPAPGSTSPPSPEETGKLSEALAALTALLETDDIGAPDYFSGNAAVFSAGLSPEVRTSLEDSLRNFDYDTALRVIKNISK